MRELLDTHVTYPAIGIVDMSILHKVVILWVVVKWGILRASQFIKGRLV